MMSGEAWLYLLAVLINAVNLFLQVFFTIMYSDLEWYVYSAASCAVSAALPRSAELWCGAVISGIADGIGADGIGWKQRLGDKENDND